MAAHLRERIASEGPLGFADFMAEALYHPDWGYYSDPARTRVGREGDFITSVSVGPVFGRLLARRLHAFWEANGRPGAFHVLEPGPESGDLARDLLAEARTIDDAFHKALAYHAIEPVAAKRQALQERFTNPDEPTVQVHASAAGLSFPFGAVIANEVIDALPVHLVDWDGTGWRERRVTVEGEAFGWTTVEIDSPELRAALPTVTPDAPPYRTEVCLGLKEFLAPLAAALESGLLLIIDYGHTESAYYDPSRREGTLQTYRGHQATDDPLREPGSQDLTAHANFTRLAAAGRDLGLTPTGFARQERYLTAVAEPLLAALGPDSPEFAATIRQFRTLTHPSMLGAGFHMLEFCRGGATPCLQPFRFAPGGLELL